MTISGIRTSGRPASNYRWVICGLLFLITTINYMDRNILGVLKPTIQGDLHFTETDFGNIIFFFSIAYAIGYAGMGWLTDKIGIRLGLAAAAILWCLASTAHGMVSSVGGFILAPSSSALAKAAISQPASRRSPHGSRFATARSPPAFSTQAAISAQCWRR
jgi:ACS family hexuronate transporter-like MFS transporter